MVATNRDYTTRFKFLEEGAANVKKKIDELNKANISSKRRINDVAKSTTNLDTQQKRLNDTTKKTHGLMAMVHGKFSEFIKTGATMAIGWQAITVGMQVAGQAVKDMMWKYSELESSMISIRAVTEATGRSYAEIMGLMAQHTDAFMSKTALAPGVMRLLSTSLDTKQIGQFIQAVKDGSAAMGYQADEQLPILARGFKQLTANILDNIGVTIYLDDIKKKAAVSHGVSIDALTEEQIHLELLNETVRQTTKYQGLYNKQMDTAKGSVAGLTVEYTKLMEQISKGNVPVVREFIDLTTDLLHGFSTMAQAYDDVNNKGLSYMQSIKGVGTEMDVMIEALAELVSKSKDGAKETVTLTDGIAHLAKISGDSEAEIRMMINAKIEDNEVSKEGANILSNIEIGLKKVTDEREKQNEVLYASSEEYRRLNKLQDENADKITISDNLTGTNIETTGLYVKIISDLEEELKGLNETYNAYSIALDKTTEGYKNAKKAGGQEYIDYIIEHMKEVEGLKSDYDDLTDSIEEENKQLTHSKIVLQAFQKDYDKFSDNIKDTNKEMRDSSSILTGLQKEYDSLNKVLYPDDVISRVDRYKEVLKEVETANKNIIKAQEELREAELAVSESRVEPEIMARMIKDEETARINLYKAEVEADKKKKEEIALRGQLKGQLKGVADAMAIEQANYSKLNGELEKYKSQQKSIDDAMKIEQANYNAINLQLKIYKSQQKGVTKDMKDKKTEINNLNTELGFYNGLLKEEKTNKDDLMEQAEEYAKKIQQEKDLLSAEDGLRDATKVVVDETNNLFKSRQLIIEQSSKYFSALMKATSPFMGSLMDIGSTVYTSITGNSPSETLNNVLPNSNVPSDSAANTLITDNPTYITGDININAPNMATVTSIVEQIKAEGG